MNDVILWGVIVLNLVLAGINAYHAHESKKKREDYERLKYGLKKSIEYSININEMKPKGVVVETLQPHKYADSDPQILKARASAYRFAKMLEYKDRIMKFVRFEVESGKTEITINLSRIVINDEHIDMVDYRDELIEYFQLKGFDVQTGESVRHILFHNNDLLVFQF